MAPLWTRGLLVTAFLLACDGTAEAAPQWLLPPTPIVAGTGVKPTPITYNETSRIAEAGMDAQGNTTVLFLQRDPNANFWQLMASDRPPGGTFSAPQPISGVTLDNFAGTALAVNSTGAAIAVWTESQALKASYRPAGGSFGPAQTLVPSGGTSPSVFLNDAGEMMAGWQRNDGVNSWVEVAFRPVGTSSFSAPITISVPSSMHDDTVRFAMNERGDAVASWVRDPDSGGPNPDQVEVAIRPANTVFGGVQVLPGSPPVPPEVAIASDGSGIAAWMYGGVIVYDTRPPGGAFSGIGTPMSHTNAALPKVGVDASGRALAIWNRDSGGSAYVTDSSIRPPGGSFALGSPLGPAAGGFASDQSLSVDAAGNAIATWIKPGSSGQSVTIQASAGSTSGGLGAPAPLYTTAATNDFVGSLSTATDGLGNGIAMWDWRNQSTVKDGVLVAAYDGAGPQLRSLSVPAQAALGQPATFSVAPLDVWSSVAATTWDFGDGTTADGPQASHAFIVPGDYTVRVTSTDSLGNASSTSRTVTVAGSIGVAPIAARDLTKPALSRVSMLRKVFRVAKTPTPVSARVKVKRGSAFRYTLSEAATVTIAIDRALPGRRSGRRCVKVKVRPRKGACTRYLRAGKSLTRKRPGGKTTTKFSGRIGKRALAPGTYRATITAVDGARNKSAAKKLSFKIVR